MQGILKRKENAAALRYTAFETACLWRHFSGKRYYEEQDAYTRTGTAAGPRRFRKKAPPAPAAGIYGHNWRNDWREDIMAITIKDIAVQTGLAISTISKYLNGGNVLPENREKIQKVIDELGFNANVFARGLKTNKSHLIGLVMDSLEDATQARIVSLMEEGFRRHGYACLISDAGADPLSQKSVVEFFLAQNVDGIVFLPMMVNMNDFEGYIEKEIPVLALFDKPSEAECDFITLDDYVPVFSSVRHLLNGGRRRIALLAGPEGDSATEQVLRGYQEALKNARLPLEPALVSYGERTTESGYERAMRLLDRDVLPDALLAGDNRMTVGAMMAVMRKGMSVPGELAVIGFDNVLLSQSLSPRLSVIVHPTEKMAALAVQTLLDKLSSSASRYCQSLRLPSEFMMGETI